MKNVNEYRKILFSTLRLYFTSDIFTKKITATTTQLAFSATNQKVLDEIPKMHLNYMPHTNKFGA